MKQATTDPKFCPMLSQTVLAPMPQAPPVIKTAQRPKPSLGPVLLTTECQGEACLAYSTCSWVLTDKAEAMPDEPEHICRTCGAYGLHDDGVCAKREIAVGPEYADCKEWKVKK